MAPLFGLRRPAPKPNQSSQGGSYHEKHHRRRLRHGDHVNKLSAESLAEVGIDISAETPKPIDPELVRHVDIVVTLGGEAHVEPVAGTRFENWNTDEPSERGIDGIERMRLVREDIALRIADLHCRLTQQRDGS